MKNWKRQHRKMTKFVQKMNKAIYKDPLWLGRFCVRQKVINYINYFQDKSGEVINITYDFFDKKTGKRKSYCVDNFDYYWLPYKMNDFIVNECKVWDEDPKPSIRNPEDFRKVEYVNGKQE